MHPSSRENMIRCLEWYRPAAPFTVADIGSSDVNGGYRELFGPETRYVGVDLEPGPNVDLVMQDPYVLPFESNSVDLIISGQMLEHCPHFWRVFTEIERVLTPGGRAFLIAPSGGPIHRYPVDCYRFYPDAWSALAEWAKLRLVHCWHDDRGPWRDLVGVFQKAGDLQAVIAPQPRSAKYADSAGEASPEVESGAGSRPYLDVLAKLHEMLRPDLYLEIGVRNGNSLRLSKARRAIGIDPDPELAGRPDGLELFPCTSDDFFFFHAPELKLEGVELAFIDGMHKAEYVYRDFINVERIMSRTGVVVIDDVLPSHHLQARRTRESRHWTGDVWRFVEILKRHRPDLRLSLLDTSPSGLLVVSGLDPAHSFLRDNYNPLVRGLLASSDEEVPADVLNRVGVLAPTDDQIALAAGRR